MIINTTIGGFVMIGVIVIGCNGSCFLFKPKLIVVLFHSISHIILHFQIVIKALFLLLASIECKLVGTVLSTGKPLGERHI